MDPNRLTEIIVKSAYHIHYTLGPGLLESVYEVILAQQLRKQGLMVNRQVPIPIQFDGTEFEEGFRADLIIEGIVLVEIKSLEQLARVHRKQVLTYLRLSGIKLGLLINFGGELLKGNIERLVAGAVSDLKSSTPLDR